MKKKVTQKLRKNINSKKTGKNKLTGKRPSKSSPSALSNARRKKSPKSVKRKEGVSARRKKGNSSKAAKIPQKTGRVKGRTGRSDLKAAVNPRTQPSYGQGAEEAVIKDSKEFPVARRVKTPFKEKELEKYRQLLIKRKLDIIGDIKAIEESNLSKSQKESSGDLSGYSLHMADMASDNYDREFYLGLADDERERLRKIDEALQRIKEKTYGICLESGKPINKKRLDVVPWAEYSIEIQTQHERQQKLLRY